MKKTFGERIRELREGKDISLRELAKTVGVSAPFLSDIEFGRRFPSEVALGRIATALGTTTEDLSQYDTRPPVEEMKRLIAQNPALGIAFRKMVEMPPEEVIKFVEQGTEADKKK